MASDHLQIVDILGGQDQKEATANVQTNLLDRALNADVSVAVSAGVNTLTTTQARENVLIELTGTPGAVFQLRMPDTEKRLLTVVNNADDVCTVQNSAGAGTGLPVINVGEASLFHYDGTDFVDISALALAVATFTGLTDTPSAFTNESGNTARVNAAENAVEFVPDPNKDPVRVATVVSGTLATAFENGDTVDGITLATGDRILLKDQSTASENGIYTVEATGAPTRAIDFDDDPDAVRGALIPVIEGTANANTIWQHTTSGAITLGSTSLTFVQTLGRDVEVTPSTVATLQTTGATVTNIAAIPIASGESLMVRGFGVAQGPSTATEGYEFLAVAQNVAGTSTLVGSATINTTGAEAWSLTIDVDDTTDTLRIRANGVAATTIDWRISYETVVEA